ncbi:MAG TPA: hypothetical protein VGW40_09250 [Allosphingosinicella sp.]|nr:hypothetical protein [Allosphingosinicella sp.]
MSGWVTAWDEDERAAGGHGALLYGGWAAGLLATAAALWLFLFALGLFTTLGSAEGSERHGGAGIRAADDSSFGLATMYASRGQLLWWDYDVSVEGAGGVRLRIARTPPSQAFIVRFQDVARSGRGRFELIAPESGFYTFSQELIPQGDALGMGAPGTTRYDLSWGID